MSQYLEEAAALLRKSAETNERENCFSDAANRGRERIAMKFAQLAAIERGLLPAEMVGDLLASIIRTEAPR